MSNIKTLQQYRTKLFEDIYNNVIPDRVPININICKEAVAEFGGMSIKDINWKPEKLMPAAVDICNKVYSDVCPANFFSTRYPGQYEMSRSRSFEMGSSGFVQHPEVSGMLLEDYDYLIEKPFDCLVERVIPRLNRGFSSDSPMEVALSFTKTFNIKNADFFTGLGLVGKLKEQFGYYADNGMARAFTTAPFDFLADQLRGFSTIPVDMRRLPDKVLAACEAIYPLMVKAGIPKMMTPHARAYSYLHMPTYMREKDFEKFYWPTFLKMCNTHAAMGIQIDTFCEDNWDRYLDYLLELPANTILKFEYGDAQLIKDKLGKKHIITGLYPITLLKTGTKTECVDKAKELVDILAPGGKYLFSFDKVIISAGSINLENLNAVTEYVRDHTQYSNAGEVAGIAFNKEDYADYADGMPDLNSRYYTTAEEYQRENNMLTPEASHKLQSFDDKMFEFLIQLLF
ncbi:MAG: uroporphyrinogen decarboxylase [Eubacteriaceae bacterium]|jgi:hypothetical protein|nr:uroporphyrinogen decarboxylase [Eubacteriaceae bacterium]